MNGIKKELLDACKAAYAFLTAPGNYSDQDYWDMREMLKEVIEKADSGKGVGTRKNSLIECGDCESLSSS